jgi:hypothetical protein
MKATSSPAVATAAMAVVARRRRMAISLMECPFRTVIGGPGSQSGHGRGDLADEADL